MATTSRLTEAEVHTACAEIAAQGERPTALTLLDKLGRGSLTTITKYLNSWNASDEAKVLGVESLPAVVKLPPELTKDGEDLIKKIWAIAKGFADAELDIQREALKQAELANQDKVEEAFKFSEAQTMKIERLEDALMDIKTQLDETHREYKQAVSNLNDAEKTNVALSKDNEQLRHEISELKSQATTLEEATKAVIQEKQELQQQHDATIKQKDVEIRSLDMQIHTLQSSLDAAVSSNEQLKTDIKGKASELSKRLVEVEKLSVRYESAIADLSMVKADLKAANQAASEAEKMVANLQGQLEVYVSLEKKANLGKGS